jgi:hypothetical protein
MPMSYGHAPGHVCDTFAAAVEAFQRWDGSGREPTVEFEVNNEPRRITISQACGLVWGCTDVVPTWIADTLHPRTASYAGAARAMRRSIVEQRCLRRLLSTRRGYQSAIATEDKPRQSGTAQRRKSRTRGEISRNQSRTFPGGNDNQFREVFDHAAENRRYTN